MKSTLTIEFENAQDLLVFLNLLNNSNLVNDEQVKHAHGQIPAKEISPTLEPKIVNPIPEIISDHTPEEVKCANPKCDNFFIPKRGGKTCSNKCGMMLNWLNKKKANPKPKKKANPKPSQNKIRKPYTRNSPTEKKSYG